MTKREEMANRKVCPLIKTNSEYDSAVYCSKDKCAWWSYYTLNCVVFEISQSLDNIVDAVDRPTLG